MRDSRRTVTILFADVSGSTSLGEQLDPESLRALMSRYFADIRSIIERHGGTVEKFIGDAVMAVFGIPRLHDDDALRAVRAASDIRDHLEGLNVQLQAGRGISIRFRTGVNTGEVVAGDASMHDTLVTGDAVNTAARLEQAAEPGEVLLGSLTFHLVRDAVTVEALEPLELKGKGEPVAAYRLVAMHPGVLGHARRDDTPLVGRDAELERLQAALAYALAERQCVLVSVIGPAGAGKSRLVAEFQSSLGDRAIVIAGRCLSYGEGISYWPLAEAVRAAASIADSDDAEMAVAKLRQLTANMDGGALIAERVAHAIGLVEGVAPQEEIFWGFRRLLEQLANDRPLIVELDDLQWADDTLLDLIELIAAMTVDAPLLLLCVARTELVERRADWAAGGGVVLRLGPLAGHAAEQLIGGLPGASALPPALVHRIADAAAGNPLYIEEMVGMLIDDGRLSFVDGAWVAAPQIETMEVPPTVAALLAARLDQLEPHELQVAERASVVGQAFEQQAVANMLSSSQRATVTRSLLALVRKELISPDRSVPTGDAFRFRHLLIRDAAYAALSKTERADLHERFANWLESTAGDRLREYEEIVGFHLAEAYRYAMELGVDPLLAKVNGARAFTYLKSAGMRAIARGDVGAAKALLARAAELPAEREAEQIQVLLELGSIRLEGGDFGEASRTLDEALTSAVTAGSDPLAARAQLRLLEVESYVGNRTENSAENMLSALSALIDGLDPVDGAIATAEARALMGRAYFTRGEVGRAIDCSERALETFRAAGDVAKEAAMLSQAESARFFGPAPLAETLLRDREVLEWARARGFRSIEAEFTSGVAMTMAKTGNFEEARRLVTEARHLVEAMGRRVQLGASAMWSAAVESLAGDHVTAERMLADGEAMLAEAGEQGFRSTVLADRGMALVEIGRNAEAEEASRLSEALSAPDDLMSQVTWRLVRGRVLARAADAAAAEGLVREALDLALHTEFLELQGDAWASLADVLNESSRTDEALDALAQARDAYHSKGITVRVDQIDERLRSLTQLRAAPDRA
jgi:predicted ATPase/class 3 adenylate cyclase